jgi:hypothetical protein
MTRREFITLLGGADLPVQAPTKYELVIYLGLPADDPFWTSPAAPWTQQRIWSGEDIARDRSLQRSGKRRAY